MEDHGPTVVSWTQKGPRVWLKEPPIGKTANKVPGVVKQEEPEVPNKEFKGFQTLKLSALRLTDAER